MIYDMKYLLKKYIKIKIQELILYKFKIYNFIF
jgi:hypothetical protein